MAVYVLFIIAFFQKFLFFFQNFYLLIIFNFFLAPNALAVFHDEPPYSQEQMTRLANLPRNQATLKRLFDLLRGLVGQNVYRLFIRYSIPPGPNPGNVEFVHADGTWPHISLHMFYTAVILKFIQEYVLNIIFY